MSPSSDMPSWTKSPADLQDAFRAAMEAFPFAERRQMFGYPAAFANGNMWTGLHQLNWVVRLPDGVRAELLAIPGASPFEPMPGRPMSGFATLPAAIRGDPALLRFWLTRAWEHALAMPPKGPKAAGSGKAPGSARAAGSAKAPAAVRASKRPATGR